jgi:hypothetical protein
VTRNQNMRTPGALLTILFLLAGNAYGQTTCDATGADTSYSEALTTSSGIGIRTITANGCPNHYSLCTGKSAVAVCGDVGAEGTASEAKPQSKSITIPSSPVLRGTTSLTDTNNGGIKCEMGAIGIALNGVSIYGGAVDTMCTGIDVDSTSSEWTGFDCCSGHSEQTGDYHYHFPPSCLLRQIGDLSDGHSPQVGWAYDGFPIYGPKGPGGIDMKYSSAACTNAGVTCSDPATSSYALDMCGGYEGEISSVDNFKYRYYIVGATSDLSKLPTDPRPSAAAAPIFAFTMNCQRGFTATELTGGSTGTTGVASAYTAVANAGVTTQYAPDNLCKGGSYTSPGTTGFCSALTTSSCNSAYTAIPAASTTTTNSADSAARAPHGLVWMLGVVVAVTAVWF